MSRSVKVDYSLYYVTGRTLLPDPADYIGHLEKALQGGTTIVQIREKDVDSREFLEVATKSKQVCDKVRRHGRRPSPRSGSSFSQSRKLTSSFP